MGWRKNSRCLWSWISCSSCWRICKKWVIIIIIWKRMHFCQFSFMFFNETFQWVRSCIWNVKFFCAKLPNSSRKPIKKDLHFKILTLQNVKFEMSEYSNTTNNPKCARRGIFPASKQKSSVVYICIIYFKRVHFYLTKL